LHCWRNSQRKTIPPLFIFRMTSKQHLIWNPFGLVYTRCASWQSRTGRGAWSYACVGLSKCRRNQTHV
jgi:hypothetical protein